MKPPFISLTDALAQYKSEVMSNRRNLMHPVLEQAFDDTFTYGFATGAATVCRLLLAMTSDPDLVAMVDVFSDEMKAIHKQQSQRAVKR